MTPEESGLLVAPLGDEFAVYDLVSHDVSIINPLAGLLLETPKSEWPALADELAFEAGTKTSDQINSAMESTADELAAVGLLGNRSPYTPIPSVNGPTEPCQNGHVGGSLKLLDHRIAFRGTDSDLIDRAGAPVELPPSFDEPTVFIDLVNQPDGGLLLRLAEDWDFPSFEQLAVQLPGVLNDFVTRTLGTPHLALRFGAYPRR